LPRVARACSARLPVALDVLLAIHTTILLSEAAASQSMLLPRHREHYAPGLRAQLEVGNAIPARAYMQAQRLRRRARIRLTTLLRGVDALVLPSMPDGAPRKLLDSSRMKKLGWRAQVPLNEGIRRTYDWYREHA